MNYLLKRMLGNLGYMDQAGDGTEGSASGNAGDDAAKAAAEAEAAKAAAEAEAAKAAAEAEAAKAAGKTGPSDEEARLLKEVMDKKTKLKEASDKIAALEAQVKKFDGIDADGVRALLAEKQSEETRKLEEKGQWDSLKKQMVEGHEKEKATLASQISERETKLQKLEKKIGELTVGNAFASSDFIKNELIAPGKARALFGAHFEFSEDGVVAYDKPAGDSTRVALVDAKGDPLSFEAAIEKIVRNDPDAAQLLKSKLKTGAGSKTVTNAKTADQRFEQPTGKDRIAAALSKGALGKK